MSKEMGICVAGVGVGGVSEVKGAKHKLCPFLIGYWTSPGCCTEIWKH